MKQLEGVKDPGICGMLNFKAGGNAVLMSLHTVLCLVVLEEGSCWPSLEREG